MFVLILKVGEYDDKETHIIAVSKNKDKLNEKINDRMAKYRLKRKIETECRDEYNRVLSLRPFSKPPPNEPVKIKVPKTREEHEAWNTVKREHTAVYNIWKLKLDAHEERAWNDARETILNKYNITYDSKYATNRYHYSFDDDISEDNYKIIDVEEI